MRRNKLLAGLNVFGLAIRAGLQHRYTLGPRMSLAMTNSIPVPEKDLPADRRDNENIEAAVRSGSACRSHKAGNPRYRQDYRIKTDEKDGSP